MPARIWHTFSLCNVLNPVYIIPWIKFPCLRDQHFLIGCRSSGPLPFARMTIKMDDFAETTVLVADRATLFRHGLIRLLQERRPGWSCAEAGTAEEVQSHLSVEPVDLVLLDLPLAGGRALTELAGCVSNTPTRGSPLSPTAMSAARSLNALPPARAATS